MIIQSIWIVMSLLVFVQKQDNRIHQENLKRIKSVFSKHPKAFVWAAWGNLIEGRPFLRKCLKDIVAAVKPYSPQLHYLIFLLFFVRML